MKMLVNTDITIRDKSAWVRWLPNALPAAGYITLDNASAERVDITKVTSPDYRIITIYDTVYDEEGSRAVKRDKVTIPANGGFLFVPGEHHLMLEQPTRLIKPGDDTVVVFFLSDGKVIKTRIPVRTSPEPY
ncbi:copper chaperone PCu(A)C [Streptomyces mutabilis]|uniref:copper chaperone PCu(A)C n=1 Tax=Streptomyces mutabilis TaxID=67332 RepID=UPI0036478E6A